MASTALSTVATPVSTSSSAAPASTSASFVWQPIAEMFTCGETNVVWNYTGSPSPLTLNITNINVTQQAPLSSIGPSSTSQTTSASAESASSTSPPLARRQSNGFGGSYLPVVNEFLIAGIDPTANNFTWTNVNVPQGWYQIYADVQNTVQATSSSFFVQNGTNTGCVPQFILGAPSTTTDSSSSTSLPVATSSPSSTKKSHSNAAAIAGGVVGGIAFLAAAFAAIFFCLRRRPTRSRLRDEDGGGRRWSELSFRKLRSGNNTKSSAQKTSPNIQAEQTIIESEEEISTVGHEKAMAAAQAAAQAAAHSAPQQPARSHSLRTSTQTASSYREGRVTNLERSGSNASASYGGHPGEAIPMEHTHLQYSPSIASPRRKPAPRYDGATEVGERGGRSSSQTTLDPFPGGSNNGSPDSIHILQHKSSFGAVRPMHVMMSDPPPTVRS